MDTRTKQHTFFCDGLYSLYVNQKAEEVQPIFPPLPKKYRRDMMFPKENSLSVGRTQIHIISP